MTRRSTARLDKTWRESLGVSVQELADAVQVPRKTIHAYEQGELKRNGIRRLITTGILQVLKGRQ